MSLMILPSGFPRLALGDGLDRTLLVLPVGSPPVYPTDHEIRPSKVLHAHGTAFEPHSSVPWSQRVTVPPLVPKGTEVAPQLLGQALKTGRYPDYPRRRGQASALRRELGGDTRDRVPTPVDYQRR